MILEDKQAMELFNSMVSWLQSNLLLISIINLFLFAVMVWLLIGINCKLRKYRFLSKDSQDKNLEELMLSIMEKTQSTSRSLNKLEEQFIANLAMEESHIQKCGLIRFQAFENTGGDQSFALCLMDAKGNGIVFSSLFGRDESRVYCKPIQNGKSTYPLSKEESEAISKASGNLKKSNN